MSMISSQDYQNVYVKFYDAVRNYLWPYSVLEELADVEVDIYTAFIDREKLKSHLSKLRASLKDVCKDDNELSDLLEQLEEYANNDLDFYARLASVDEVNPEKDKVFKVNEEDTEEDTEL